MLDQNLEQYEDYKVGDMDHRPWGSYRVTNTGIEDDKQFCEKKIIIKPYKALSLQRHKHRAEYWHVQEGTLTVIINGKLHTLDKGSEIRIPQGAVHCMINMTDLPVTVYEKQMGLCYEDDNERLSDSNNRETAHIDSSDINALESKKIYDSAVQTLFKEEGAVQQKA